MKRYLSLAIELVTLVCYLAVSTIAFGPYIWRLLEISQKRHGSSAILYLFLLACMGLSLTAIGVVYLKTVSIWVLKKPRSLKQITFANPILMFGYPFGWLLVFGWICLRYFQWK
jgi:hypothetical protein